jgi:DHA1 family bicyclomycin/chloramphenicol resistance-like MFS transporter
MRSLMHRLRGGTALLDRSRFGAPGSGVLSSSARDGDGTAESARRWSFVLALAFLSALTSISTSIYIPSLPSVAKSFAAGPGLAQWTIGIFFIGQIIGTVGAGMLGDLLKQEKLLPIGIGTFILGSGICAVATSAEGLLLGRFIQGIGASTGPVIATIIARRTASGAALGVLLSTMSSLVAISPAVSPILGGLIDQYLGWRWSFTLLFFGAAAFVSLWNAPSSSPEQMGSDAALADRVWQSLAGYGRCTRDFVTVAVSVSRGLVMAGWFCYVTIGPLVFMSVFGLSAVEFGHLAILTAIGYGLGANLSRRLHASERPGLAQVVGFVAIIGSAAALFLIDLAAGWAWLAIISMITVYNFGNGILMPSMTAVVMNRYKRSTGAASSFLGLTMWGIVSVATNIVAFVGSTDPYFLAESLLLTSVAALPLAVVGYLGSATAQEDGAASPAR